jgi:hypothetical protein
LHCQAGQRMRATAAKSAAQSLLSDKRIWGSGRRTWLLASQQDPGNGCQEGSLIVAWRINTWAQMGNELCAGGQRGLRCACEQRGAIILNVEQLF